MQHPRHLIPMKQILVWQLLHLVVERMMKQQTNGRTMAARLRIHCSIISSKTDKHVKDVSSKTLGFFFFDDLLKEIAMI